MNGIVNDFNCILQLKLKFIKERLEKKDIKLNFAYFWIIQMICLSGGTIDMKTLVKKSGRSRSTVSTAVDKLEKLGYIKKEFCQYSKKDLRIKLLLEEQSPKLKDDITSILEEFDEKLLKNISNEELETFKKVLNVIKSNLTENDC